MASIHQIRGAILEEAVAFLLRMVGYRLGRVGDPGTRNGHSGLELQGRGYWHQIDTLACFDSTPAFMYPLRLIIEAKCHKNRLVGINVARNVVGVLKDISENYFTYKTPLSADEIQIQRYNYNGAIFSVSGYTSGVQKYAIAHQIFLIDYRGIHAISPLIDAIMRIELEYFKKTAINHPSKIKEYFGGLLGNREIIQYNPFVDSRRGLFLEIRDSVQRIQGSYYGMLQGRWPLHILSLKPLPEVAFRDTDVIRCKVYGYRSNVWSFSPIGYQDGQEGWFKLEFNLPEEIANLVASSWDDPIQVANIKESHFSYIVLSGRIGNINRVVRLELDREWIESYKEKMRKKIL